jgi:hypothetical protein
MSDDLSFERTSAIASQVRAEIKRLYPFSRFAVANNIADGEIMRFGVEFRGKQYYTVVCDDEMQLPDRVIAENACARLRGLVDAAAYAKA